jgi:hypothetical protein
MCLSLVEYHAAGWNESERWSCIPFLKPQSEKVYDSDADAACDGIRDI